MSFRAGFLLIITLFCIVGFGASCDDPKRPRPEFRILTTHVPAPVVDAPYSLQLLVSRDATATTWTLESGTLPDNMTLAASGVLSGTPTALGNSSVTIGASCGGSRDNASLTIQVRPLPEWTFMVYLDGDHNLERHTLRIFRQLEEVGSSPEVNIVVQIDRIDGFDNSESDWTDTRRYFVLENSGGGIESPLLETPGELDMSNADVLSDFVAWSAALLPASKYALFIFNHGGGWRGSLLNTTSGAQMDSSGLYNAFAQISAILGRKLDLCGLDECLMAGVEIAGILSPHVDWLVASERYIHNGMDYAGPLQALRNQSSMTAQELAAEFVTSYDTYASWCGDATMSVTDLSKTGGVISNLNGLTGLLGTTDADVRLVSRALISADGFSPASTDSFYLAPNDIVDIHNFAFILSETSGNAAVIQAAVDLMNSVSIAVTSEIHHAMTPYMRGISLYFPVGLLPYGSRRAAHKAVFILPDLDTATWPDYMDDFYQARDNLSMPVVSSFTVTQNTCDFSVAQDAAFSVNASNNNVWCLDAKFTSGNNVWFNTRYLSTANLANGQPALSGDWTAEHAFSWDGRTWALGNGTDYCRFTAVLDQKNKGIIRGNYEYSGETGTFLMFFNTLSGVVTTFANESWTFQDGPPEGMLLEPWILEDTTAAAAPYDNGIVVGSGGVTLSMEKVPEGSYSASFKLRDLAGTVTSARTAEIIVQE